MTPVDAVVVGSGPNGLTAAARLALAGHRVLVLEQAPEIGGGSRTADLGTGSGAVYDTCAAVHPAGAMSPAFRALHLDQHGLGWLHPPVPLAHPLDGEPAALLHRSLEATAQGLGPDEDAYRALMAPLVDRWAQLTPALLSSPIRFPAHPVDYARFAALAVQPVTRLAERFCTDAARALLGGLAVHGCMKLTHPFTGGLALGLGGAAHSVGWPVAEGGSAAIAAALAEVILGAGGVIEVGRPVRSLRDLPPHRVALLDVTPRQVLALDDGRLGALAKRSYRRWRYGPGASKVDYLLDGPMPWADPSLAAAGTVHIGGTLPEMTANEAAVVDGRLPEHPFVLAAQPCVADPSRARPGQHVLWAYAHVPNGSPVDAADLIDGQLDRFAPGWRDLVRVRVTRTAVGYEQHNPNDVGGDIMGGAMDGLQLVLRPRLALDPYATGIDGVYLCSSSTPPGGGVHGMCGWHAAGRALRALGAIRSPEVRSGSPS